MSDCITNVMGSKIRTCGNCISFDDENQECIWVNADGTHEKCQAEDTAESHDCHDWEVYVPTVEQRFEQLEQVAKRMYDWCDGVANRYFTIVPETVRDFRKQLEALGVSIDE